MAWDGGDDVFDLLAGSVAVDATEEMVEEGIPAPFPPSAVASVGETPRVDVLVQTVLLDEVRDLKDDRFNTQNHHAWAPFRDKDDGSVLVDPAWWRSLVTEFRTFIESAVRVVEAPQSIEVPHEVDIKNGRGSAMVYRKYVDGFAFSRWRHLQPTAVLVPLMRHDRNVLELAARRHALGGTSGLQPGEMAEISDSLMADLTMAIAHVGGRAFAKTTEKSAKNDADLRPHETPQSILEELTKSPDVLKQSLGKDAKGDHRGSRYLVVQPWVDGISAANEFRVFIIGGHVAAISQQMWSLYAGHTTESAANAVEPLRRLWYEQLRTQSPYLDCTLDAYIVNGVAHLIEINPCGLWGSSGSSLFHWVIDYDLLFGDGSLPVRVVVERADACTIDARIC